MLPLMELYILVHCLQVKKIGISVPYTMALIIKKV